MVKAQIAKIFRLDSVQEKHASLTIVHDRAIGSTGTESYAGYPSEEYLNTLRGTERADIFDKMRRSDAQVKMLLTAVMGPILKAKWRLDPAESDEPWAKEDAELIQHILFNGMDKPWNEFLREALSLLTFGHSVFEVLDKTVIGHPKYGSYNGIASFAFRSQRTIERWNLDVKTDKLLSVSQYAYGDLDRLVDIPAEYLLVFSLDKEGSNYEGISALRAIYGNFFRKNVYLKLNAIGVEKFAIPTPLVEVPNGKQQGEAFERMKAALEAYLGHEKGYLIYPEGWKVDLKTNTYDPEKVEITIDNEDKRMAKSFLANFLELGMNGFGSQSLGSDLSDFFMHSMDYVASIISGGINQTVIPRLIRLNRGPRPGYPKLRHSGISDSATRELADIVKGFTESGLIRGDDVLEENLREQYGLPKSDKATQRQQPSRVMTPSQPSLAERIMRMRLDDGQKG